MRLANSYSALYNLCHWLSVYKLYTQCIIVHTLNSTYLSAVSVHPVRSACSPQRLYCEDP